VLPFEGANCVENQPKVFDDIQFTFPFEFQTSPAMICCVFMGMFASLVAPFAGFLASGFKRANNIKDFGTTLPGHGGFLDRLDCVSFTNIFALLLLTNFLYKEYILSSEVESRFTELSNG
jgi:phosphatidate cytidylyltransferase